MNSHYNLLKVVLCDYKSMLNTSACTAYDLISISIHSGTLYLRFITTIIARRRTEAMTLRNRKSFLT